VPKLALLEQWEMEATLASEETLVVSISSRRWQDTVGIRRWSDADAEESIPPEVMAANDLISK
jgi:hypothetical protein